MTVYVTENSYFGPLCPPLRHAASQPPDSPRAVLTTCGSRLRVGYYLPASGPWPAGFYTNSNRYGGLRLDWTASWQECDDPKPRIRLTKWALPFLQDLIVV